MMKTMTVVLAVLVSVCVTCSAQVTPNIDYGTKELRINGYYDGNHPLDYLLDLDVGFGYFVMDNLQVGGVAGWQSTHPFGMYELGIFGEYNFDLQSTFVPFAQAAVLWAGAEADDDLFNRESKMDKSAWVGRLGAGVKYFLHDDVALSLGLDFDFASADLYPDQDGNVDSYSWTTLLGLNFYFD